MNSSSIERVINLATKDTKKGARVVAKVFYANKDSQTIKSLILRPTFSVV
jgi:hypothetical protein